jgi:hypothetical protein
LLFWLSFLVRHTFLADSSSSSAPAATSSSAAAASPSAQAASTSGALGMGQLPFEATVGALILTGSVIALM